MFVSHLLESLINGSRASTKPVQLIPGQIQKGTILRAFPGDMVLVQMGSTPLYAKLDAPLQVGQEAWFQVLPGSQPLTLKVVDLPNETRPSNYGSSSDTLSIEHLLKGLGLKANREAVHHVKLLIETDIPLNTRHLSTMLDLLAHSPNPKQTVQALAVSIQRGLPLNQEIILSLESFLFGKPIEQTVPELLSYLQKDVRPSPLVNQLSTIWQQFKGTLEQFLPNELSRSSNLAPNTTPNPVPNHAPNPTVSPISNATPNLTPNLTSNHSILPNSPNEEIVSNSRENVVPKLLNVLGIQHERNSVIRFMSGQPQMVFEESSLHSLKSVLLKLISTTKNQSANRELSQSLEQGVRWITGQQLFLAPNVDNPWSQFILQIPLMNLNQEFTEAFIQMEGRKDGRDTLDVENCHLYFHLDLEYLQRTLIDVKIINRMMNITIFNDLPEVKHWVSLYKNELETALKEMDYNLISLNVANLPLNIERNDQQRHQPMFTSYQGVDVRI